MMAPTIRWNLSAFRAIRTSEPVQNAVNELAEGIAARANSELGADGYVARPGPTGNRARAAVITATGHAIHNEARHGTAVRAMGGG